MRIAEALKTSGIAEAMSLGYNFTVKDDQEDFSVDDDGNVSVTKEFLLSISKGAMPPHEYHEYDSVGEIERAYPDLDWEPVEEEEG